MRFRVTLFGGFSRGSGRIAARPGETPFLDSSSLDAPSRVSSVFSELVEAVSAKEGISFSSGTIERLAAYTDVVADFPCGVKEFEWRNQYFYDLGDAACPIHNGLLRECAEKGKLGFDLP